MKNIKLRYYLRGLGIGVLVTAFIMGTAGKGGTTMTDAQIRERALELGMVDGSSLVLSDLRNTTGDAPQETAENNQDEGEPELSTLSEEPTDVQETDEERTSIEETHIQETEETDSHESGAEETGTQETDAQTADTEGEGAEASQEIPKQTENISESEAGQSEDALSGGVSEEESAEVTRRESRVENGIAYFEIVYGESSNSVSRVLAELGLVADAAAFDNYLCSNGYSKRIHTGSYAIVVGTGEEEIAKIITGNR